MINILRYAVVIVCLLVMISIPVAMTSAYATGFTAEARSKQLWGSSAPAKESCAHYTLSLPGRTLDEPVLVFAEKLDDDFSSQGCNAGNTEIVSDVPLVSEIKVADEKDGSDSCKGSRTIADGTPTLKEYDKACSDWPGLKRDTLHIFFYQAVSVGILYFMPESTTNWTKEEKHWSIGKWLERIPKVHWDNDSWFFNYVQHPYWGLGYYVRAGERGYDHWNSFLYSAVMSTIFEFTIEGQFERPSVQDLVATPVIGSLAGYYLAGVRQQIKAKEIRRWYDEVALVVTDPFGSLNSLVDRLLGLKEEQTRCSLMFPGRFVAADKSGGISKEMLRQRPGSAVGMQMTFAW